VSSFQQRLARLEERYQQGVAEFKKASAELAKTLETMRQKYPPMTAKQRADLAEHYRSGAAGPQLREIQQKVDAGELTWEQVARGTADPRLTEAYWSSFGDGGMLLKAAADGEPIEDYLPDYTDDDVSPQQESTVDSSGDDDFGNRRYLGGGERR
jgi:hypothetical protein